MMLLGSMRAEERLAAFLLNCRSVWGTWLLVAQFACA